MDYQVILPIGASYWLRYAGVLYECSLIIKPPFIGCWFCLGEKHFHKCTVGHVMIQGPEKIYFCSLFDSLVSCVTGYTANVKHFFTLLGKMFFTPWGCGHFLGPLILRYPHLSCCYKSLALSVLNWTQPSEGKLNSFFCVPVYIFIENLDKLLDSNISPWATIKHFIFKAAKETFASGVIRRAPFSWHRSG